MRNLKILSSTPTFIYIVFASIGISYLLDSEMMPWAVGMSLFAFAKMKMTFLFMSGHGLRKSKKSIIGLYVFFTILLILLVLLLLPLEGYPDAEARIRATMLPVLATVIIMILHWFFWEYNESKYRGWESAGDSKELIEKKN